MKRAMKRKLRKVITVRPKKPRMRFGPPPTGASAPVETGAQAPVGNRTGSAATKPKERTNPARGDRP
jgi:hypothetical protein